MESKARVKVGIDGTVTIAEKFGISWPWVVLENLGQNLPNNSQKFQRFRNAYWDPLLLTGDPLVSGADDDSYCSLGTSTEDTFSYYVLTTRLEGWYLWENVSFVDDFSTPPGTAGYLLVFNSLPTANIPFNLDKNMREAKD